MQLSLIVALVASSIAAGQPELDGFNYGQDEFDNLLSWSSDAVQWEHWIHDDWALNDASAYEVFNSSHQEFRLEHDFEKETTDDSPPWWTLGATTLLAGAIVLQTEEPEVETTNVPAILLPETMLDRLSRVVFNADDESKHEDASDAKEESMGIRADEQVDEIIEEVTREVIIRGCSDMTDGHFEEFCICYPHPVLIKYLADCRSLGRQAKLVDSDCTKLKLHNSMRLARLRGGQTMLGGSYLASDAAAKTQGKLCKTQKLLQEDGKLMSPQDFALMMATVEPNGFQAAELKFARDGINPFKKLWDPATSVSKISRYSIRESLGRFRCPHCPKRFTQRGILRKHTHSHTKPIACEIEDCTYTCAMNKDLRRHQAVKHVSTEGKPSFV